MSNPAAAAPEPPRFISVAEAAPLTSVSDDTVRRLLDRGQLAKYRFGRRVLVDRQQLEALVLASAG
jgi:excisionase family DNA binding protein